jgi:hypothetical protein
MITGSDPSPEQLQKLARSRRRSAFLFTALGICYAGLVVARLYFHPRDSSFIWWDAAFGAIWIFIGSVYFVQARRLARRGASES